MTHPAIAFLKLLDPSSDARFNVETFADVAKGVVRPKHDPLLRRHPDLTASDVEALIPALTKLNEKGRGGLYRREPVPWATQKEKPRVRSGRPRRS